VTQGAQHSAKQEGLRKHQQFACAMHKAYAALLLLLLHILNSFHLPGLQQSLTCWLRRASSRFLKCDSKLAPTRGLRLQNTMTTAMIAPQWLKLLPM
jgi:hypothetical protein